MGKKEQSSKIENDLRVAREYLEQDSELGKSPTTEELWDKCADLQRQVWNGINREIIRGKALNRVADMALVEEKEKNDALKSNAEYLKKAFETMPSGDITDKLYRLRHIEDALRHCELYKSRSTTKRLLTRARDRGIIPRLDDQDSNSDKTWLSREETQDFIHFVAGEN